MDRLERIFAAARSLILRNETRDSIRQNIDVSANACAVRDLHAIRHGDAMEATPESILGAGTSIRMTTKQKEELFGDIRSFMHSYDPLGKEAPQAWKPSPLSFFRLPLSLLGRQGLPILAGFLLLATSTATISAAQTALPGDALYALKVQILEPTQSALLTFAPEFRVQWDIGLLEKRMTEAERLLANGSFTKEKGVIITKLFSESIIRIEVDSSPVSAGAGPALVAQSRLEGILGAHERILLTLSPKNPSGTANPPSFLYTIRNARIAMTARRKASEIALLSLPQDSLQEVAMNALEKTSRTIAQVPRPQKTVNGATPGFSIREETPPAPSRAREARRPIPHDEAVPQRSPSPASSAPPLLIRHRREEERKALESPRISSRQEEYPDNREPVIRQSPSRGDESPPSVEDTGSRPESTIAKTSDSVPRNVIAEPKLVEETPPLTTVQAPQQPLAHIEEPVLRSASPAATSLATMPEEGRKEGGEKTVQMLSSQAPIPDQGFVAASPTPQIVERKPSAEEVGGLLEAATSFTKDSALEMKRGAYAEALTTTAAAERSIQEATTILSAEKNLVNPASEAIASVKLLLQEMEASGAFNSFPTKKEEAEKLLKSAEESLASGDASSALSTIEELRTLLATLSGAGEEK